MNSPYYMRESVHDIVEKLKEVTERQLEMSSTSRVFISHSHVDRQAATEIDSVLLQHGAETYLDQRQIEAGDVLPDRIEEGIRWCSVFLLVWSVSASRSKWVKNEWKEAWRKEKRIVPFSLDGTKLPTPLDALVYVDSGDRKLAYSKLLTAVFGKTFTPLSGEIFAGTWEATFDAFGLVGGTSILELRRNGQVVGEMQMSQGGVLGPGLEGLGMGNLLNMKFPISGRWTYESKTRVLELNTTSSGFGTQGSDTVRIIASGNETGPIQGQDLSGRTWTLRRIADAP